MARFRRGARLGALVAVLLALLVPAAAPADVRFGSWTPGDPYHGTTHGQDALQAATGPPRRHRQLVPELGRRQLDLSRPAARAQRGHRQRPHAAADVGAVGAGRRRQPAEVRAGADRRRRLRRLHHDLGARAEAHRQPRVPAPDARDERRLVPVERRRQRQLAGAVRAGLAPHRTTSSAVSARTTCASSGRRTTSTSRPPTAMESYYPGDATSTCSPSTATTGAPARRSSAAGSPSPRSSAAPTTACARSGRSRSGSPRSARPPTAATRRPGSATCSPAPPTMDRLEAIVWFNENKERDWRAAPTPEIAAALRPGRTQPRRLAQPPSPSCGSSLAPPPARRRQGRRALDARPARRASTRWHAYLNGTRVKSVDARARRRAQADRPPGPLPLARRRPRRRRAHVVSASRSFRVRLTAARRAAARAGSAPGAAASGRARAQLAPARCRAA